MIRIVRDGSEIGQYSETSIPLLIARGTVLPTDHYLQDGMTEWKLAAEMPEMRRLLPPPVAVDLLKAPPETQVFLRRRTAGNGVDDPFKKEADALSSRAGGCFASILFAVAILIFIFKMGFLAMPTAESVSAKPEFNTGFSDGAIVGNADARDGHPKKNWERTNQMARRLSQNEAYVRGWRSGYNAGFDHFNQ